jgi:hypothetical protein
MDLVPRKISAKAQQTLEQPIITKELTKAVNALATPNTIFSV